MNEGYYLVKCLDPLYLSEYVAQILLKRTTIGEIIPGYNIKTVRVIWTEDEMITTGRVLGFSDAVTNDPKYQFTLIDPDKNPEYLL